MKLENKGLTTSFFENNEYCFQLWINLNDKEVDLVSTASEKDFLNLYFSDDSECSLVAESEEDEKILNRFCFKIRDKWQLWLIFPSDKILENKS